MARRVLATSALALAMAFGRQARADEEPAGARAEGPPEGGVAAPQTEPLPTPPAPPGSPAPETVPGKVILRPHRSIVLLGVGMFGSAFVASAIAGGISERPSDRWLFAPVVGPWVDLGNRDCAARPCGSNDDVAKAFVVASGMAQAAGIGVLVWGLLAPEVIETRVVAPKSSSARAPEVAIVPSSWPDGVGVAALGTF
ncbi:MAG: hypothetical protein JST00_23515 [Deltaproteobacteria bacterium]|nr:hypothetical protein [Deltaproteobacteria bacterium]